MIYCHAPFEDLKVCGANVVRASQFWEFRKLTAFLRRSPDCSCYVSRQMPAPPLFRLQEHTDLRAPDFARSADL